MSGLISDRYGNMVKPGDKIYIDLGMHDITTETNVLLIDTGSVPIVCAERMAYAKINSFGGDLVSGSFVSIDIFDANDVKIETAEIPYGGRLNLSQHISKDDDMLNLSINYERMAKHIRFCRDNGLSIDKVDRTVIYDDQIIADSADDSAPAGKSFMYSFAYRFTEDGYHTPVFIDVDAAEIIEMEKARRDYMNGTVDISVLEEIHGRMMESQDTQASLLSRGMRP